jgi:hypothetical protein
METNQLKLTPIQKAIQELDKGLEATKHTDAPFTKGAIKEVRDFLESILPEEQRALEGAYKSGENDTLKDVAERTGRTFELSLMNLSSETSKKWFASTYKTNQP